MMIHRILPSSAGAAVLAALALCGSASAVVLNGISAPTWDRSSTEGGAVAWEYWDVATGQGSFTDLAPDISQGGSPLVATLTQSFQGVSTSGTGGANNDPARLLASGVDTQFLFSLAGTGSSTIDTITLQIKHSNFLDPDFEEITSPFLATLNGGTAISGVKNPNGVTNPETYRWAASDAGTSVFFWVYTYTWTGLDIAPGQTFNIDFSTPLDQLGFGLSTDTVALDVHYSNVPEPASIGLAGLGAVGLLARRRRK